MSMALLKERNNKIHMISLTVDKPCILGGKSSTHSHQTVSENHRTTHLSWFETVGVQGNRTPCLAKALPERSPTPGGLTHQKGSAGIWTRIAGFKVQCTDQFYYRTQVMPAVGLEPTTTRLKVLRSTNWARQAELNYEERYFSSLFDSGGIWTREA